MSNDPQKKHLFDLAVEISDPQKQAQFLEIACAGDHKLQAELEELLHHDAAENNPLDVPLVPSILKRFSGLQPGSQIGPYKIREQIGEGGFGQVYVAEQTQPIRRKVALKLIKPGMDSKDVVGRFAAERQALAMMDHPHVAKVLDAGTTDDGRPYFVMELVKGIAITQFCDRHKLETGERLRLFIDACHAVQHAHQKGIIHRDLKPSNILVTMRDDKPIVKVIDFGVAKALSQPLTEHSVYTAFGQMIGTPMYMSPEQAQLNEVDVDTRSDVYTLGVLLYELLTGTTPFDRETLKNAGFDEMRRIICEDEPLKPSSRLSTLQMQDRSTIADQRNIEHHKLGRNLQGELDWIVMKALEKDRNRRYESPKEFADDIDRFLTGQAVQACPPSVTYRLGKFAKRHRGKLTSVALLLMTLCAFGAWEFLQSHWHFQEVEAVLVQLREEKEASDRAGERALRAAEQARKTSYISEMKLAFQRYEEGRLMEASQILTDQIPAKGERDLRHVEWHYLNNKLNSQFRVIGMHTAGVQDLALFPDGKRVVSAGMDGVVAIWDIDSATLLQRFERHHRPIHAVAVSPNGRWIAYGEEDYPHDSHVVIIDAESGTELARLNSFLYPIRSMDFSGDGKYLMSAANGEVALWEFQKGFSGKLHKLPGANYARSSVRMADDGFTLATMDLAEEREHVGLWDVTQQTLVNDLRGPSKVKAEYFAYNASQQWVARLRPRRYQGSKVRVELLDVVKRRTFKTLGCLGRERMAFSRDGTSLLVGSYNGWIESWKVRSISSSEMPTFDVDPCIRRRVVNGTVKSIRSLDANAALVSGTDGAIVLYRFGPPETDHHFAPDEMRVRSIASSNDGRLFAWQGADNRIRLTEYATGKLLDTSDALPQFARTLVFSPCGTLLAAQCDEKFLQCWDISQKTLRSLGDRRFGKHSYTSTWGHVAIDRKNVIGFGDELDDLYFVDTDDITRLDRIVPKVFANSVLLSPDGSTLAASNLAVRVYNRTAMTLRDLFNDAGKVYSMAFSHDSRWLASGHHNGTVRLRNLSTGNSNFRLDGHNYAVRAMAFARDGTRLITGDGAGYVGFWDVETGDCYGLCLEVPAKSDWIRRISMGPHDRWLDLTAGHGGIPLRTRRLPLRIGPSNPDEPTSSAEPHNPPQN